MDVKTHIENTRRTWRLQSLELDLEHAILGIWSDGGELIGAFKKVVGYSKELDKINVLEECGDIFYYICRIQDQKQLDVFDDEVVIKMFTTVDKEVNDYELLKLFARSMGKIGSYCEADRDKTYCSQELNYMTYILHHILNRISYTIGECRERNIAKLKQRYPDKWDADAATNRDLSKERIALENKNKD